MSASTSCAQKALIPGEVPTGSLEALKWLGVLSMTADHINTFLLNSRHPVMFNMGRVAFPLFGFILAHNLARPAAFERGVYRRTLARLACFGVLALPACLGLGHNIAGWYPLNVMFTFCVVTGVLHLLQRRDTNAAVGAALVFVLGSAVVEYWWPGVAFCLATFCYTRHPHWGWLAALVGSLLLLSLVNVTLWTLAALPIIMIVTRFNLPVPRCRWAFYAYYPAHLTLIWITQLLTP